jgi:dipeptidyl-peptidase 4
MEVFLLTRSLAVLLPAAAALALAAGFVAAQSPEKPLTVEDIFSHGPLIGEPPEQLTWSPDGKHLTYLEGGVLLEVDSATGRTHVLVSAAKMSPLDDTNLSEHDRAHRLRYNMASYFWAPDSTHLLFDSNGRLWYYDLHNGAGVQIGFTGLSYGDDPKFSPDGCCVSFIRDHGLAIVRLREPGTPTTTLSPPQDSTADSGDRFLNGQVDWVYEEELDTRSNYFWSPDSRNLAFLQMNETQVPRYPITDWIPNHATVNWQHYPQPGDPNPEVHLGVVSARGGRTTWMKVPLQEGDDYIPRFGWIDRKTLWIEVLSRDHKHRILYFADVEYGDTQKVLEIDDDKFLDEDYDMTVGDGSIVLSSWSDGHNHLYLYSYDKKKPLAAPAKLERQLTKGDFEVGDVYDVDTARRFVDYASNEGSPLEQQVWQVNFDGKHKQLTAGTGFHQANFAPDGSAYTDKFSTRMQPPVMQLCKATDVSSSEGNCRIFWQTHALDAFHLSAPRQLEVKAHDGITLYATLLLPAGSTSPASVPLIVNPYGGPHEQSVVNEWKDSLFFDELLAQHGFAVLHADNRGMGNRGRAFAQAAYRNFGPVQLEDQLTVIDAVLAKYPQLDPKRLGWWGWSWGGTFTLYSMTHSDRFIAGVAVAPVTDWRNYDSIYTERYLGLPEEDAESYRDFSVVNSAANLKGHLLLVHGTGDDNVHFENTVQFVQKLIGAGIPYDLQIYPRKTHSIAGPEARTHLYRRILAHFEEYLKPDQTSVGKPEAPVAIGK